MENTLVLYPAPGIGHMISMLELAKLILRHYSNKFSRIHILINTGFRDMKSTYLDHISSTNPSIVVHQFPFIQADLSSSLSPPAIGFKFIRKNAPNVHHALQEISKTSSIRALIIDFFCTSAMPYSNNLGIPVYYFFTSGAAAVALFLYFPTIHKQTSESFKDLVQTKFDVPGLPPIPATQMPEPVLDRDDPAYDDILYYSVHLPKSSGIIVNTFDELEPIALKAITDGLCVPDAPTPPLYNIGPLIADADSRPAIDGDKGIDLDQSDCFSWLDRQPDQCVVFLCFGSRGTFSVEQIKEIAKGLERSGKRFLWVVKKPLRNNKSKQVEGSGGFEIDSILPERFLEKTKGIGLVVKSWIPQLQVLRHPAVGGFVTHCGWNSTLEAVVAGVPLVAWPLHAEQHVNMAALVQDMKMAIPVEQGDDGIVRGEEVEKRVRELMDSERGRELRKLSQKTRDIAAESGVHLGSSSTALASLIHVVFGN
uniref:Glycosyltransferase n=1 Tax=Gardenia jasminoides TaxID=114476 RepID=F8WKX1_GARJA|nr:UDP-glucose glucosyltransferase [Gardenia jasminoides]